MNSEKDIRELRIGDLGPYDTIDVKCVCGRSVNFIPQYIERHRWPKRAIIREMKFRCTVLQSAFRLSDLHLR